MGAAYQVGEELVGFSRLLDQARLVMYAGATWDWHRLHYDLDYVREIELPAPIVDGQMLGALFAEQVYRHFGPGVWISSMKLRFRSMIYAGERVEIGGKVTSAESPGGGDQVVVCRQAVTVGSRSCATCVTEVVVGG